MLADADRAAVGRALTGPQAMRRARTCYDHLAGELGVALADAFERDQLITASASGWTLTSHGEQRLSRLGVDPGARHRSRRPLLRPCLDWTERRPHLAGRLGQALASELLDLAWVRRIPGTRALQITPVGQQQLLAEFAVRI